GGGGVTQTVEFLLLVVIAAALLSLAEIGFRFGIRLHVDSEVAHARARQLSTVQEAVLVLVSLMLGFTFAMALERYNTRRELVIKEANAVGTTFLRASMLPQGHQAPVRAALRQYVDLKLNNQRMYGGDTQAIAAGSPAVGRIHSELWRHATESAREQPNDITQTFIETLNSVIDVDEERLERGKGDLQARGWVELVVVS